eukprot:5522351-Karenia_brevis.AAC.1
MKDLMQSCKKCFQEMEHTHKWSQPAAVAGVKKLKVSTPYSRNDVFGSHSCFRSSMSEVVYADEHEA